MSQGRIVETGPAEQILRDPQEEYTRRLVAAAPSVPPRGSGSRSREPHVRTCSSAKPRRRRRPSCEVDDLVKTYKVRGTRERLTAVDHVSFETRRRKHDRDRRGVGVGQDHRRAEWCSVSRRPPAEQVRVDGEVVETATGGRRRRAIRRAMQPVFQDPYASLNPMFTIEHIIDEPLRVFRVGDRASRRRRVAELLDHVALPDVGRAAAPQRALRRSATAGEHRPCPGARSRG